jgi:alpha-tubulin suppressor-like RCC1 family protein
VRTDGTLACWGNSARGETNVPAGTFASIAAGPGFACAVSTDGAVACWGSNNQGTPPAR